MVNGSQDKDSDFRVFGKRNEGYLPVQPIFNLFFSSGISSVQTLHSLKAAVFSVLFSETTQ